MPRIVADTNIYISALNFAGTADEVLALGRAGLIDICISPVILDEIGGVLARKFRWSVLECALAARADAIVTGDHHLLRLKRFQRVRIMTPREFLDAETRR